MLAINPRKNGSNIIYYVCTVYCGCGKTLSLCLYLYIAVSVLEHALYSLIFSYTFRCIFPTLLRQEEFHLKNFFVKSCKIVFKTKNAML